MSISFSINFERQLDSVNHLKKSQCHLFTSLHRFDKLTRLKFYIFSFVLTISNF